MLAEAESEDPTKNKQTAAEELRKVVATVGKPGSLASMCAASCPSRC